MKKLMARSYIAVFFPLALLSISTTAWAAAYYVRPISGEYGLEDGSDYDNAFDGFADIAWGSLGGGDILFVAGTHSEQLSVEASGANDSSRLYIKSCRMANGASTNDAGSISGIASVGVYFDNDDWVTLLGLTITNLSETGVYIHDSQGVTIDDCTITYDNYGIWVWGSSTNWIVEDSDISYNDCCGLLSSDGTSLGAGIIRRNTFDANGQSADPSKCTPGDSGKNWYHAIYIDVDTGGVTEIYENKLINTRCGHGIKIKASVDAHHNFIKNNSCYNVMHVENGGVTSTQKVHNNIIVNPNGYGYINGSGIFFYQESAATATLYDYNNTIYSSGASTAICGWHDSSGHGPANWYIKNNILYSATGQVIIIHSEAIPDGTLEIDYNLAYTSAANEYYYDDVYRNFAYWQGTLGFDTHGKCDEEPLFNNAESDEFWLQSSSPAIDEGCNLGDDYDNALDPNSSWPSSVTALDQDDYGSGWEIGAYGYQEETKQILKGSIKGSIR